MKADLIAIVKKKLGESPSVEQVVEWLSAETALTPTSIRRAVVGVTFFDAYKGGQRSARDVEEDIAADHDGLTRDKVKNIRLEYADHPSRRSAKKGSR